MKIASITGKKHPTLMPQAWLVIFMNALYNAAEALCSVFVGVYFYINSLDINTVFYHYTVLYIVTPIAFIFAGWLAKSRDRTLVFRIGLILHALYYASLLFLREASPQYAGVLGGLLGITWGFFWAGNNTFQYDFSTSARGREYFLGLISVVSAGAKLFAPLLSGFLISNVSSPQFGYELIFVTALLLYSAAIAMSFRIPPSKSRKPFSIRKALLPPPEHRDWRIVLVASASLAGSFHIFHFLLALIMFMQLGNEAGVGGYVSFQGLITIITSYLVGRYVQPSTRKAFMFWGVAVLVIAGACVFWETSIATLLIFGLLRSISLPLFGIPDTGIRYQVMDNTLAESCERIEYLCAWEVPLAIGRIVMMGTLTALYSLCGDLGLRITLLILCLVRISTYWLMCQVSFVKHPLKSTPIGPVLPVQPSCE